MKRFLLLGALFLCSVLTTFAQYSGSGSGTESDPYLIFYADQLNQVRNFLNKDGVYFKLMSDIDLTDWIEENNPSNGWQPVGASSSAFKGIFDGNNHTISGLTINRPSTENVGFFGYIDAATIKNLTVKGNVEGGTHVGGICGAAGTATFSNCDFIQDGIFGIKSHGNNTGGMAGYVTGQLIVSQCSCNATILGNGDNTGGLIGCASGSVDMSNNQVKGNIKGTGLYTGGVIGYHFGLNIVSLQKCTATGSVQGNDNVGGIAGGYQRGSDEIDKCSFVGKLKGINNVGGILGYSFFPHIRHAYYDSPSCLFTNNYAIVNINASGDHIGGLIGKDEGYYDKWSVSNRFGDFTYVSICSYEISNSYSSGSISGKNYVGGLVGYKNRGSITKCFSNTSVYGTSHVGGIVGYGEGASDNSLTLKSNLSICNVVNASESNAGRVYGSIGSNVTIGANGSAEENGALTTCKVSIAGVVQDISDNEQSGASQGASTLKYRANYVAKGWDFNKDWDIQETETYPYKPWQAAPPKMESDLVSQETTISGKSINGGKVFLQIGDNYRDSVECSGNHFSFDVPALQSGDLVRLYAVVDAMGQSLYTDAYVSYPGSGTETDPYRVYTAADLQGVYKKGYYKLMNDVDLTAWINKNSPTEGWPAIGKNGLSAIYFDGGGHTISGLWYNTTATYNGLFSNFPAGYIKNLKVRTNTSKTTKGGDYSALLIGRMVNGKIENVDVQGTIDGAAHVGGVVAVSANNQISKTSYRGQVTSSAENAYVGGLVGQSEQDTFLADSVAVNVTATGNQTRIGGLVGQSLSNIKQCFAGYGTLTATGGSSYVGGLVGENGVSGVVKDCYATADVNSTFYGAGLVAYNYGTVSNSYALGNIKSTYYGAGVVGYNDGTAATISNVVYVNVTDQSGWSIRVLGGFKNGAPEPGTNNYALNTMILSVNGVTRKATDNILDGYAKTEAGLMSSSTYMGIGWDFSKTWGIDEGSIYPYLLWEVDVNPVADITFNKTTMILPVGKKDTIQVSVLPLGATNKRLEWKSGNTAVATVADGVVTAVAEGEATITATTTDGSKISATCKVTVTKNKDAAIANLQKLVDEAQDLYKNSTEGSEIGQYASGSRAALLKVINAVKAKISDTMSDEALNQCVTDIQNAIDTFKSKQVTAGPDTDISSLNNTVYIENFEAQAGSIKTLSVKMKNTLDVVGLQFDLYLPDGMTFVKDQDGEVEMTLSSGRTTARRTDLFKSVIRSDGSLRVLAASTMTYPFTGNDGEIIQIKVKVSDDMQNGDYPIIFRNVELSSTKAKERQSYVKSTVSISSYKLGDVDNDGSVTVSDVVFTSSYILDGNPSPFNKAAADIDGDGEVTVSDVVQICTIILNEGKATVNATAKGMVAYGPSSFEIAPFIINTGSEQSVDVLLSNACPVLGYQMDIALPDGITLQGVSLEKGRANEDPSTKCEFARLNNGKYRILCFSMRGNAFNGNEGAVAHLTLMADNKMTDGCYQVEVSNVIMACPNGQQRQNNFIVPFQVGSPTYISRVGIDANKNVNVYGVDGALVRYQVKAGSCLDNLPKGIYVVNGRKFFK